MIPDEKAVERAYKTARRGGNFPMDHSSKVEEFGIKDCSTKAFESGKISGRNLYFLIGSGSKKLLFILATFAALQFAHMAARNCAILYVIFEFHNRSGFLVMIT